MTPFGSEHIGKHTKLLAGYTFSQYVHDIHWAANACQCSCKAVDSHALLPILQFLSAPPAVQHSLSVCEELFQVFIGSKWEVLFPILAVIFPTRQPCQKGVR